MSTCEPCRTITDCLQFPFVFYNINAGKRYTSEVLSYILPCPDGSTRTIVLPAGTFVFTLPFPSDFIGPFPPLVFPCSAGGFIIKNVPDGATQAQIDALVTDIFQQCGLAVAQAQLNCAPRSIANAQVVFDPHCAPGSTLTLTGTPPSWITIDAVNNLVIGAAGQFTGNSLANANATAQAALDGWANQQIALGNLVCASGPPCITNTGNITVPGVAGYLAISTDLGTNRMVMGINTGMAGDLEFINTATNAVINSLPALAFTPDPPAYAAVNQTFWVPELDGINNDGIAKYDKDGNFVASVTPVPGAQYGTHIAYESTTGRIYGFASNPADADIYDVNPSTNAVTLHTIAPGVGVNGPGAVYASPGFIFVNSFNPDFLSSMFHVFTVPGFVQVGTIDLTVGGWDGAFAYSPDTGKVYFSQFPDKVLEINPATAAIDFTYTLANRVTSLEADPVTHRLIGTDNLGNGIVIDPIARSVICTPALPIDAGGVNGLAIDPNVAGRIYANDDSNLKIQIYT